MANKTRSGLDSGLDVLEFLSGERTAFALKDIAAAVGMSKSGVHSLLATLSRRGYVERTPRAGYRLGIKAWELGGAAPVQDLAEVASEHMAWVAEKIQEGVILGKLDGADVVYLHLVESVQPVRVHAQVGDRILAYCTSTGLALLSSLTNEQVRALLPARMKAITPESLSTREEVIRELDVIRRRGYAINRGGWRTDVGGISVCVRDDSGATHGAICVAIPRYRMTKRWLEATLPCLVEAAARIGGALTPIPVGPRSQIGIRRRA